MYATCCVHCFHDLPIHYEHALHVSEVKEVYTLQVPSNSDVIVSPLTNKTFKNKNAKHK